VGVVVGFFVLAGAATSWRVRHRVGDVLFSSSTAAAGPSREVALALLDRGSGGGGFDLGRLRVSQARPRILFTPATLARARQWFKDNPFAPRGHETEDLALQYLLSGEKGAGRTAVAWLLGFELDVSGMASNDSRWSGELAALVFDWCHDLLTPDQRQMLTRRWTGYLRTLNAKPWGGPEMPGNNYFWGNFRNSILWGLATFHENPEARGLLDEALNRRWAGVFRAYAATGSAAGGVPPEGSQYGRYMLSYPMIPLATLANAGIDVWQDTAFFKEALLFLVHSTTPSKTLHRTSGQRFFEVFPYNNDQFFSEGGKYFDTTDVGQFLTFFTGRFSGTPYGAWAAHLLRTTEPTRSRVVQSVALTAKPQGFERLPLDYHARGMDTLFMRDAWSPDAMVVNLQLGTVEGVGHSHLDAGTFQIWRKGRWLSRETAGYTDAIASWRGGDEVDCRLPVGHNSVLFEGYGMANAYHEGLPKLLRLGRDDHHLFAAVDLTPVYLSTSEHIERDVNPYAVSVVREFIFVRSLGALVVHDRLVAKSGQRSAKDAVKTFVVHFEHPPEVDTKAGIARGVHGDQVLDVKAIWPRPAFMRVVRESKDDTDAGQHRLEIDFVGSAEVNLVHVLQARDGKAMPATTSVAETARGLEITLTVPEKGVARMLLEKGRASVGGALAVAKSAEGLSAPRPLATGIARVKVGDAGPVWQPSQ
jgi:hypothetical protein